VDNLHLLHKSQEESRIDRLQRHASNFDAAENLPQNPAQDDTIETDPAVLDSSTLSLQSPLFQEAIDLATLPCPDWYVQEALTSTWDNEYFSTINHDDISPSSLYYSDIPSKQLFTIIKDFNAQRTSVVGHRSHFFSDSNEPIEPHIFLSSTVSTEIGQHFVEEFNLNDEQALAFRIIANHTIGQSNFGDQLRMGIFGEGGTGKSRLIMAIKAWFCHLGRSESLVITATTGTAAYKINGTTLHSGVGIRVEKGDRGGQKVTEDRRTAWINRQYLIVDEVSMMDCNVLSRLHTQLSLLKSRPSDLFGGINIIFLGDFLQFPSVSRMDVYLNTERCESGHRLWRSLNAVVILKKQMRQANDPEYASLLSRIRTRSPTDADIDMLNSRIAVVLPHMSNLPVIVRRHSVRHAINLERLQRYADSLHYDVTYCIALIRQRVDVTINEAYRCRYGELGMEGDAVLTLAPGVPLLITKNIPGSQSLGTFNLNGFQSIILIFIV